MKRTGKHNILSNKSIRYTKRSNDVYSADKDIQKESRKYKYCTKCNSHICVVRFSCDELRLKIKSPLENKKHTPIMKGKKKTALTMHYISSKVDRGDIIDKEYNLFLITSFSCFFTFMRSFLCLFVCF